VRLRWTRAATHDLDSVENYISRDNPDAAVDTVVKIIAHVALLAEYPGMGRPGRVKGTREMVVPGLPYIVAYRHEREAVTVLGGDSWCHEVARTVVNAR
jgi:toxin ParE1/3/4